MFIYLKLYSSHENTKTDSLIKWLNSKDSVYNIATVPYHLGGWRIVQATKHNWLYNVLWMDTREKSYFDEKYVDIYPLLLLSKADKIIEEYNIDYIFIDIEKLGKNILKQLPENLKQFKISDDIVAVHK